MDPDHRDFRLTISGEWAEISTTDKWPQLEGYRTAITSIGSFYHGDDSYTCIACISENGRIVGDEIELMRDMKDGGLEFESVHLRRKEQGDSGATGSANQPNRVGGGF